MESSKREELLAATKDGHLQKFTAFMDATVPLKVTDSLIPIYFDKIFKAPHYIQTFF